MHVVGDEPGHVRWRSLSNGWQSGLRSVAPRQPLPVMRTLARHDGSGRLSPRRRPGGHPRGRAPHARRGP
jgi:hypothetical protein